MSFAATELTNNGLTGPKLVKITSAYAADFCKDIPHVRYPFDSTIEVDYIPGLAIPALSTMKR